VTSPIDTNRRRLESVDLVRGLVMILMALDHTRDYFGDAAASPTNLATASAPLFLTRWITHFCAPSFFFLAGLGAFLSLRRRTRPELARFLVTRGLWLVLLEMTVMRFFWQFNADYHVLMLTVLWALGWSMVVLAALVFLPEWSIWVLSLGLIVLHNLADPIAPAAFGALAPLWTVLHRPGPLLVTPRIFVFVAYPLIPWIGVMAAGFALGKVFTWPDARRRNALLWGGLACTLGFIGLRALNGYGDPVPWKAHATTLFTVLSFMNTNKYPPSLLFLLMTLGPALLALRAFDGRTPGVLRPALVYGRVPMFYYVIHVLLIHILAAAKSLIAFHTLRFAVESPTVAQFPITQPPGWPSSLPVVYLMWAIVVVLAYPICKWYAALKARRTDWWLSYL
jgi:uncharacterized membrane protein